ncbi:reverse transcriptase domain-containing protein [Tanacetum coccineum]
MFSATTSLTYFSGETIWPLGQLRLLATIGDAEHSRKAWMNFMIVRSLSPYNGIIRRHGIREIQAVPSTAHGMLKFPVDGGIVTIRNTILIPTKCATVTTSSKEILKEAEVRHKNFKVALHLNFPDQEVAIGGTLSAKGRTKLCSLLKENLDIFKKRGQAPERAKAIQAEVQKLVEARIMREVYYHDWLSNPVMVKKHDGSWRMCVDFTDLNKACYHQIQMAELDEEKTAFHTSHGVYCYTKMPFGLKNAGATYQRMVDKAFDKQVPEGIKPYPDRTEAVLRLPSPRTIKDVQSLNGKLASLNRFLSKSAEKSLPLFKTLKKYIKKSDFHWTPEVEQAFKQPPKPKEELIIYLSASHGAISAVLMTKRGTVQVPVYFILADFLVEKPDEAPPDTSVVETPQDPWILFMDGSSCVDGSEYEALIAGLRIATQMGVRNVHVSVDSKLVANQVLGTYVAKEENMIKYLEKAKSLVSGFANFSISQVPRSKNKKADALSKIASTSFTHLSKQVLVEVLKEESIQEREVATVVEKDGPTWMTPIMEYLKDGTLPDDRKEASKLRIKARQYELLEGVLYRRSFLKLWLRTMVRGGQSHAVGILLANHASGCTGYDMQMQRLSNTSSSDPFPEGLEKVKFFIVAMDYFTKWIEAKAMATISGSQVKKFVLDNIVCRFSLPGEIVSDNEVAIPAKVGMPTYHTAVVDAVHNDEELRLNLDLLEERRERAAIREANAKLKMTKYYNARVRGVTFRPGDFVYRSNDASHAVDGGKLGPKWEGPYEVMKALEDGAYRLRSMDETVLPRTWKQRKSQG